MRPFIFAESKHDKYQISKKNEKGKFVKSNFVYSSDTNSNFLSIGEIKKLT